MKKIFRLAFVWTILLTLAPQEPFAQYAAPDATGTSKIRGKVLDADGKSVRGARVLAYHLSSERLFSSERTRRSGEYRIAQVPYGYYDLAIETPDGLFVANRVVNVAPSASAVVTFTILPFDPSTAELTRKHPASEADPAGLAELQSKPRGREFWRSPAGVAVLAGVGGGALLAIAATSDSENDPTPVN